MVLAIELFRISKSGVWSILFYRMYANVFKKHTQALSSMFFYFFYSRKNVFLILMFAGDAVPWFRDDTFCLNVTWIAALFTNSRQFSLTSVKLLMWVFWSRRHIQVSCTGKRKLLTSSLELFWRNNVNFSLLRRNWDETFSWLFKQKKKKQEKMTRMLLNWSRSSEVFL